MKFIIDIAELKSKCADLTEVIRQVKGSFLETIKVMCFNADYTNGVTATANNLNISITKTLNAEVVEAGKGIIPYEDFQMICKLKGLATISFTDTKCRIEANRIYEFTTESANDFPTMPDVKENDIVYSTTEAEIVGGLKLESILSSDGCSNSRYHGIWVSGNNMMACDGHRVGNIETTSETKQAFNITKFAISLMKKTYDKKSDSTVNFYISESGKYVKATSADSVIVYIPYDGEVYDFSQTFSDAEINKNLEVVVNKEIFENSVQFMCDVKKKNRFIQLEPLVYEIDKDLRLSIQSGNKRADEVLPVDVVGNTGEVFKIAFNPFSVQEILKLLNGSSIHMTYNTSRSPSILTGENAKEKYLILPVRTDKTA